MSKDNNLYAGLPIIAQLLQFLPQEVFKKTIEEQQSDRYYKKVKTWDQLVFMLYAVLTKCSTLREVIQNFLLLGGKLSYCRLTQVPKRSSISDANAKRKSNVFGSLYMALYLHYKELLSDSYLSMPINGEVAPSKVEVFDATTISLFKDVFKACGRLPLSGKRKGGIKAFTKITLSERVPNLVYFSDAAKNDKNFLKMMELPEGTISVFDKGFHNFEVYGQWTGSNRYFVTRLNDNAVYRTEQKRPLGDAASFGISLDCDILLTYTDKESKETKEVKARAITYTDPVEGKKLVFLTNLFDVKALTVCLLYKNRWTIEPLYKQIKQNFELTYFLSDSEEGIKTQIWIALILNLIFTVIHKMIKEAQDFSTMVKVAAKNTGSYIKFVEFLSDPTKALRELEQEYIQQVQLNLFANKEGGTFLSSA
jgi:Domain of unknown function (DUF4372)/Transposase DDE domain